MHTSAGGVTGSNPMTGSELYHSVMQESATSAVACFAGQHACHLYDTAIQHVHTMLRGEHLWLEQQEELLCCMQLMISALSRSAPGSCAVSCLPQTLGVEQSG